MTLALSPSRRGTANPHTPGSTDRPYEVLIPTEIIHLPWLAPRKGKPLLEPRVGDGTTYVLKPIDIVGLLPMKKRRPAPYPVPDLAGAAA